MADAYRVLVTGSRSWTSVYLIRATLHDVYREHPDAVLISGRCPKGADAIAEQCWAAWCGHAAIDEAIVAGRIEPHAADWERYGRAAGFRRNAEMVVLGADACLCFAMPCADPRCTRPRPHDSHGASDCAERAAKAGIPVRRYTAAPVE